MLPRNAVERFAVDGYVVCRAVISAAARAISVPLGEPA